jgi:hypothetical protein
VRLAGELGSDDGDGHRLRDGPPHGRRPHHRKVARIDGPAQACKSAFKAMLQIK